MRAWIVAVAAAVAGAAVVAPAVAAPERKTELVDDGKAVDSLLLRYGFESTWVLDVQSILMQDAYREYYLVTLEEPCEWIERPFPFAFAPKLHDRVRASLTYDVRDDQHEDCRVAKIEKVSLETAKGLRAKLAAN
jgi:hypothetical protein